MRSFRYERVRDAEGAVAAAAGSATAYFLGGGTNLVDLMKLEVEAPELLIDVNRAGLDQVDEDGDDLAIGASVRNSDLAAHPLVRSRYPLLAEALLAGASGQLRNMATVGGNLMQRTRCRYFQDITSPCNKRSPGSGCPAIDGDHHNLGILGTSDSCVATHPSDMAVAMVALGADVELRSAVGGRRVPIGEFYRLPGDDPGRDTTIEPGELITRVLLPAPPRGAMAYRKVRERASFAFAVVSVAAVLSVDAGGDVEEIRLALGGVAHQPWRAERAEESLRGGAASSERFADAMDRELTAARPLRDNAYKVPLARQVAVRVLSDLLDIRGGGGPQ